MLCLANFVCFDSLFVKLIVTLFFSAILNYFLILFFEFECLFFCHSSIYMAVSIACFEVSP